MNKGKGSKKPFPAQVLGGTNMNRLPRLKWSVIILLLVAMCHFFPQPIAHAYYGGMLSSLNPYSYLGMGSGYGLTGLYGSSLYGGMYGSSLYGGMYGGSLYGGMYGSSLYGGMYGSSLYGGMYGSSLYGGMYGSSLYGGMYGGSLYGGMPFMGGYYGLGRNYYSSGMESLTRNPAVLLPTTGGATSLLPTTTTVAPTVTITIPIFPDPTGSYFGSWTSLLTNTTNPMTMTITYNILTIGLSGTAGLLLNKLIPIAINVSGINNAPSFVLSGNYFDIFSLVTYTLELTCTYAPATLTLPAIIRGTYLIHDPLYLKIDAGGFSIGRL